MVKIYTGSTCTGSPLATDADTNFDSPGIAVPVPVDQSTHLRATATDTAGNESTCSAPLTYVEDSSGPTPPTIMGTTPASPARDNNPEVQGAAAAGSTVRIYSGNTCTGTPLATDTAANFASPGITITAPTDQSINLRASAVDSAGNSSTCSSSITYTEDSTPPQTTADLPTDGTTAMQRSVRNPAHRSSAAWTEVRSRAAAHPRHTTTSRPGDHRFEVRATDVAGNTDATPAREDFTVVEPPDDDPADETPPITRIERKPDRRVTKRMARFRFSSNEPDSRFRCEIDGRSKQCEARFSARMKLGRHVLEVAAIDLTGNVDPTPATHSWLVKKPTKRSRVGDGLRSVAASLAP